MKGAYLISIFLMTFLGLQAQVRLHVTSVSSNTPQDASIFFAGSLNGWEPGDSSFILQQLEDGGYVIDLPAGNGQVEFKFTRGSWQSVESNGNGAFLPNRSFTYGNGDTLELHILGWEDLDEGGGSNSTANEQVSIWNKDLYIPQLDRNRRVWVYLPQDYEDTDKRYPVLYMHDGQNIFDASTSFSGEWQVDESLNEMEDNGFYGIIVVAIDNGKSHRIDEYSPFVNAQYGGGEGDAYLSFMVETLKPLIDAEFRTMTGSNFTGIMGSSMGGIISHYAHFKYPHIFGRAGIFSPSYWFSDSFFDYTEQVGKTDSSRIYILAGEKESSIAESSREMNELLQGLGFDSEQLRLNIKSDGSHSEWFWAREFKEAVEWLFSSPIDDPSDPGDGIKVFPNPAGDSLKIKGSGEMNIKLYGSDGKLIGSYHIVGEDTIELPPHLETGQIIVVAESSDGRFIKKVLVF